MLGGIIIVAVASAGWWITGGRYVSIDDAYVRAAKETVATDVSGIVAEVPVHEGQLVKEGRRAAAARPAAVPDRGGGAQADIGGVISDLNADKLTIGGCCATPTRRQRRCRPTRRTSSAMSNLVKSGGVTRAEYDNARFQLAADQQALDSLKVQAQVQLAKLRRRSGRRRHTMSAI